MINCTFFIIQGSFILRHSEIKRHLFEAENGSFCCDKIIQIMIKIIIKIIKIIIKLL